MLPILQPRRAICQSCKDFRCGTALPGIELHCHSVDDIGGTFRNCEGWKHKRWKERIELEAITCRQWLPAAGCPSCIQDDPIPEPEGHNQPDSWEESPAAQKRHIEALAEMGRREFSPPENLAGDGIVYCGENHYWPMIVVAIEMLRRTGCDLPVQIWHNGDIGPELLGRRGVTTVDARYFRQRHPARILRGWESKSYAIMHSGFRRVLFLDADCYAVGDPKPLFDVLGGHAMACWTDLPHFNATVNWQRNGLEGQHVRPIQGGQMLFDIVAFWRELVIAHWINQHSEYFYKAQFGDQDSWRVAIALTKKPYLDFGVCPWHYPAFICRHDDKPYFVHRCQGKIWRERVTTVSHELPLEKEMLDIFSKLYPTGYTPEMLTERNRRIRTKRRAAVDRSLRRSLMPEALAS